MLSKLAAFAIAIFCVSIQSLPAFSLTIPQAQNLTSLIPSLASSPVVAPNLTASNIIDIENCDEYRYNLNERINQAKSTVLKALEDSIQGSSSTHGFKAMFKEESAQPTVEALLTSIYWQKELPGLRPSPGQQLAPRYACVDEDSGARYAYLNLGYDPWQRCLAGSPRRNPIAAFYANGTSYVFICPAYIPQPPQPETNHCPAVHMNKFAGDPNAFYKNYQVYSLIYSLVRFYLGDNALTRDSDPPEQLDWNECVRLDTLSSVLNPTNVQIYIALVAQQCTDTPDPFSPPLIAAPASPSTDRPLQASVSSQVNAMQTFSPPLMFPGNVTGSNTAVA